MRLRRTGEAAIPGEPPSFQLFSFETRSFPTLTRSYPRRFTFYVAHPIRSIQRFSFPQWNVECLDTAPLSFPLSFTLVVSSRPSVFRYFFSQPQASVMSKVKGVLPKVCFNWEDQGSLGDFEQEDFG